MLRSLIDAPLQNVHVTLVNPGATHTYSGMVPGVVAGHYVAAQAQIELMRLAARAGVELIAQRVAALDAGAKIVILESGTALAFDLASLNLGSLPNYFGIPGAREHAVAAKPFEAFLARWNELLGKGPAPLRIAIAGAGAAGAELAMAMRHALERGGRPGEVVLYSDKNAFSTGVTRRIQNSLKRNAVEIRPATPVIKLEPGPVVVCSAGRERFDAVFWTAGAAPLPWLRDSALALDPRGFVLVDATLRSVSHPRVFAAGDTATIDGASHPKSGVYAVRHAAVLAENLRSVIEGKPLRRYEPQTRQLALLSCGAKYAIASRGGWSAVGAWAWWWKDWLDRRWIARFR